MNFFVKGFIASLFFCVLSTATAEVRLELTQGQDARTPIVVAPFSNDDTSVAALSRIISDDLNHSGRFRSEVSQARKVPHVVEEVDQSLFQAAGYDDLVIGQVKTLGAGRYQINYTLIDLFGQGTNPVLSTQRYTVTRTQLRQAAHTIANDIYYQLTGFKGFFTSHLTYVSVQKSPYGKRYKLIVSDYDGFNPQTLVDSNVPIMSPRWSPDNKVIAYVTFNQKGSVIYNVELATGKREKIADYKGVNGAPAWAPDGHHLALVLSKSGSPNIYIAALHPQSLIRITDGRHIDNEPAYATDGRSIYFTSNRRGTPQIYRMNLSGGDVTRITEVGDYNASVGVSPQADQIVVLHRLPHQSLFSIATMDLKTGIMKALTSSGLNQSPSYAPNGQMIVYATDQRGDSGRLAMVSLNGKSSWTLPLQGSYMQEPDWSH